MKDHPQEPILRPASLNRPDLPARRKFFGDMGVGALLAVGMANLGAPVTARAAGQTAPLSSQQRRAQTYQLRLKAALDQKNLPLPPHLVNGDEALYPNRIGNFTKALPHNDLGEVDPSSYAALLRATATGAAEDFEAVRLGGPMRLANPQAAFAYQLEGADSHHLDMIPPPAFASEEIAGEMVEVYWQALMRDVPFARYASDGLAAEAVNDLRRFPQFAGSTAEELFRGDTAGDRLGPYLSQFLWLDIPYGPMNLTQKYRVPSAGEDHMTEYDEWLAIQNGQLPSGPDVMDTVPRYLRNGRDLAGWVHQDFSYQGFLNAALILLSYGPEALDEHNPYRAYARQGGFVTFGGADILSLVAKAASCALKAAWCQKWSVHRRLRPEEFAGRVHNHLLQAAVYPIHDSLWNSSALSEIYKRYGTYLLPMVYPEGCPTHPAYPAGHATIAGACATVLKAFFSESFEIPDAKMAADDGLSLSACAGTDVLAVGGELNKLAANIALGRDIAGVHWRSDGIEGLKLGETVALRLLQDLRETYTETFPGFSLTTFDGRTIAV